MSNWYEWNEMNWMDGWMWIVSSRWWWWWGGGWDEIRFVQFTLLTQPNTTTQKQYLYTQQLIKTLYDLHESIANDFVYNANANVFKILLLVHSVLHPHHISFIEVYFTCNYNSINITIASDQVRVQWRNLLLIQRIFIFIIKRSQWQRQHKSQSEERKQIIHFDIIILVISLTLLSSIIFLF